MLKLKHKEVGQCLKKWLKVKSHEWKVKYIKVQEEFDNLIWKKKRDFQAKQRDRLFSLQSENPRHFWKLVKSLHIDSTNTNHENIPWQIKLNDHVITDKEAVLEEWMKIYNNS